MTSFITINDVCSLGTVCLSSQLCIDLKLKLYSSPFDWIFSNPKNIIHILKDDFSSFLDKDQYVPITPTSCGHKLYDLNMFNHHNPKDNLENYDYFTRCIDRFKKLLSSSINKLFIISYINESISNFNKIIDEVCELNEYLKTRTVNFYLFVIISIQNNIRCHDITLHDNIRFLLFFTISKSDGGFFYKRDDNIYLQKILLNNYSFQITDI